MDTFMDKLAQRLNAQEIIKANSAADAAQLERYKEQVLQYEKYLVSLQDCLQSHEQQNEKLKNDLIGILEKLNENTHADRESVQELSTKLEELFAKSDDFNHKEDVKVYRNVQAALVEENTKQTESIREMFTAYEKKNSRKTTAALFFSILAGIGAVAAVTLQVLSMFGMRFYW